MEYSRENLPTATILLAIIIVLLYGIQNVIYITLGEYPGLTHLQKQSPGATAALYIQGMSSILLLILSPFLHAHFAHFLTNSVALLFFGSIMEKISKPLYLVCLLISSYLSSILTYWAKIRQGNPFPYSIGISAGVFAVAAFVGSYYLSRVWRPILKREIERLLISRVVVAYLGLIFILVSFGEFIFGGSTKTNLFGHVLGSLFGILIFVVGYQEDSKIQHPS